MNFSGLGGQVVALFTNFFQQMDLRNIIDILIVAFIIYNVLKMFMRTRANSVIKGVVIILVVTWLSELFQLNAINWLLQQLLNMGTLLLVIVFQPEIRRALEQLGRSGYWARILGSANTQRAEGERIVDELLNAFMDLSRKRIGALIVVEGLTGMSDIVESGTNIDAEISAALIENIFEPNTPLHDGAVIVRDGRIVAAACILQLSDDNSLSRELGTRHRAAIGVTETTDAVSLIVSEETGTISVARDGHLTRYLDKNSLKQVLDGLFLPTNESLWQSIKRIGRRLRHA